MLLGAGTFKKLVYGFPLADMEFDRRSYRLGPAPVQRRLENVAKALVHGFNLALEDSDLDTLRLRLSMLADPYRGLAFEGITMGLTSLDIFPSLRSPRRALELTHSPDGFQMLGYAGIGMGLAVFRFPFARTLKKVDKVLGWMVVDGYAFFYGLLRAKMVVAGQRRPSSCKGVAARVFDAGLGRSIWFSECASVDAVVKRLGTFPEERRHDLWAGVGTACTYAGGVPRADLEAVLRAAGPHSDALARGAALAAHVRAEARNVEPHVETALEVIWKRSAADVAGLFDDGVKAGRSASNPEDAFVRFVGFIEKAHQGGPKGLLADGRDRDGDAS